MITTTVFLEAACWPENEVTAVIRGEFIEGERGSRDEYGAPIEPDIPDTMEIFDIYIEEIKREVTLEEAAVLFEKTVSQLKSDFIEALFEAYESDFENSKMPF